jgi:hypothetical protein
MAKMDTKPGIELRNIVTVFAELNELPRQINGRVYHLFPDRAGVSDDSVKAENRDGLLRLTRAAVDAVAPQKGGVMPRTMYCLMDAGGHIYTKDGADSYTDVATEFGLDECACRQYRWDLTNRRRLVDRELPANVDTPYPAQILDAGPDVRPTRTASTPVSTQWRQEHD